MGSIVKRNANKKNVTIYDIAEHCGLSKSTVSYIVSNSSKYKASSRAQELVKKAIVELGYQPNITARNLRTKKTQSVGITTLTLQDRFYANLVEMLQQALAVRGYTAIFSFPSSSEQFTESLDYFISKGVDGIINCSLRYCDNLKNVPLPCVNYGIRNAPYKSDIFTNVRKVVFDSVRHFVELGHRKIAFLGYDHPRAERFMAFNDAMKYFGIEIRKEYICWRGFYFDGGVEGMRHYVQLTDRPTAVICHNDPVAIGFLSEAYQQGVKVPDDISVIGANNILESQYTIPPLTTFEFPAREIAKALCDIIIEKIKDKGFVESERSFDAKLILRESTAKKH